MRIIAVDVGTSALKAALFNAEKCVSEAYSRASVNLFTPKPGCVELKPEELWEALVKVVQDLVDRAGVDTRSVEAIAMDTQMAGVVAVDKEGTPLTNVLTWLDSRAAGYPRELFGGYPKVSGYNLLLLTKLLRISGGAPGKLGKDPLSKYAWLMAEQPDLYAKTWKFLDVKGYLLHRMTSKAVVTVDEASITWLADTRNPGDVKWSRELIESFGLDEGKLPEIVKATDVVGSLTADAAKELNLRQDVKVVAGCGDVPATAIGSGGVEDFEVHLYIGTGNWFASHVPERRLDVAHYMGCILSAIPNRYLLVAEQQTGAIAIDYLSKLLGYSSYAEVDEDVAKVMDESSRLIFLPWLFGERSPVEDPSLRAALVNIALGADRGEVMHAVIEGLALNMKWEFQYFKKLLGRRVDTVFVVGGGSLYNTLCRALANALEMRVARVAGAREATLLGAIVTGLVARGYADFGIAKRISVVEKVFEPESRIVELYRRKFKVFLELYKSLRGIYKRLNRQQVVNARSNS